MILKKQIGHLRLTFVLRHQWEKEKRGYQDRTMFRTRHLGIFYRKDLAVGTWKKGKEMFSSGNLAPSWMFGVELWFLKFWFDVSWRVRHFGD